MVTEFNYKQSIEEFSKKLVEELKNGGTESFKNYLKFSQSFHNYSLNNQILILSQKKEATKVASFLKWKELGRNVKKGEKSIKILAPMIKKSRDVSENGEKEITGIWFKTVSVFDISQTEGEEITNWEIRGNLGDNDFGLYESLKKEIIKSGVNVEEKSLNGPLGVSYGGLIEIENSQDQVSKFLTLIHEQAHEILHKGSESKDFSKNDKECQAEATAYIVASHFGLESIVSAEYLINWGNSEKEFLKNLSSVVKASQEILKMLGNKQEIKESLTEDIILTA